MPNDIFTKFSRNLINFIICFLIVFIAVRIDSILHHAFQGAPIVAISSGIAIVLLIQFKNIYYIAAVALAIFMGLILGQYTVSLALGVCTAFCIEIYLGYFIYSKFKKNPINDPVSNTLNEQSLTIIIVALVSPIFKVVVQSFALDAFFNPLDFSLSTLMMSNYLRSILGILIIYSLYESLFNFRFKPIYLFVLVLSILSFYIFEYGTFAPFYGIVAIVALILIKREEQLAVFFFILGLIIQSHLFKYFNVGPFVYSSDNQESAAYQLVFLALIMVSFTALSMKKSTYFNLIFNAFLTVLFFTAIGFAYTFVQEEYNEEDSLKNISLSIDRLLSDKMILYDSHLRGIAGFIRSTSFLNETIWSNYAKEFKITKEFTEVDSFGAFIGESNELILDNYIYPESKSIYISSVLKNESLRNIFINNRFSELPIISDRIRIGKNDDFSSLSMIVFPIINNLQVKSWAYAVIDNEKLFSSILKLTRNYNIDVYDGSSPIIKNIIFKSSEKNNFKYEMLIPISIFNHQYLLGYSRAKLFKGPRVNLSSIVFFVGSFISSLFIVFLFMKKKEELEARNIEKELKATILDSEQRYKAIFTSSSDGIVIFNKQRLVECNLRFYEMFAMNEDISGLSFLDLFPTTQKNLELSIDMIRNKLLELETGHIVSFEAATLKGSKVFYSDVRINKFNYLQSTLYIASFVDISTRKKMEENLVASKELALEAARSKSNFLSNMSHEIRTPLNGIIGLITLLLQDREHLNHEQEENLKVIEYSANHLVHILNEILDFSKVESGKIILEKKPTKLKDLAQNILKIHSENAKKKDVELVLEYDESIPEYLVMDELRNGQIINNLVSNAIKFTEVGIVKLKMELISMGDAEATIRFTIVDTGVGIPYDKLEHIFEQFTQADEDHSRRFGGTGLGLPISKKLIELQGGVINIHSILRAGTEMSYDLVFLVSNDFKAGVSNLVTEKIDSDIDFCHKEVLIVEDNEVNILVLRKYLEKWKLKISLAQNGLLALESVQKAKFDLIFMDIHMPEMDGITATKKIREMNINTPIIALSADVQEETSIELKKAGIDDFIAKPFRAPELLKMLKIYLR